nr:MAG TPA: hypothetical protein [Bacteriophage sp.]
MNKVEEAIYNLNSFQASSAGTQIPDIGDEYTEADE